MTTYPLVSIIIPVFNSEKYLRSTILSAINQSWKNTEIILVDDGSTDASAAIAQQYVGGHFKYFHQKNSGASVARNYGLRESKGDYIQFLDADDLLSTDKIELQVKCLEGKKNYLSMSTTIHFVDEQNLSSYSATPYEASFFETTEQPVEFLKKLWGGYDQKGSMITVHSWLTPRSIIEKTGPWNETLSLNDDGEYFARVILNSEGIIYSSEAKNYYRKNIADSTSALNSHAKFTSMLKASVLLKNHLLSKDSSRESKIAIYRLLMDVAIKSYPKYKNISNAALRELPKIESFNYIPEVGGNIGQMVNKVFGWRITRSLQNLYRGR